MKYIIHLSIVMFLVFLSCNKNTTEPVENQNGKQKDVAWNSLTNSTWPINRGNSQSNGRTSIIGPKSYNLKWQVEVSKGIYNGPAIGSDGTLYFGTEVQSANSFYAMNPNGTIKWTFTTDAISSKSANDGGIAIASDGSVYFSSSNGYLYALDQNGNLKWKYMTNSTSSIPVITIDLQGNIYVATFLGELICLDNAGNLKWKKSITTSGSLQWTSISKEGNRIYVTGQDGLIALDLQGNQLWKYTCYKATQHMLDYQGNIYFTANDKAKTYFYSITPEGNVRWKYELVNELFNFESAPTIDINGNLYVQDRKEGKYGVISLDYNGNFRWRYAIQNGDFISQPLICDAEGNIYFGGSFGSSYWALNSLGQVLWTKDLENKYQVDLTGAFGPDGTLYIGTSGPSSIKPLLIAVK